MPKDQERSINPAQQQRKLDKAKALKKGKAELQSRRNEKLARRNPDRLQRQVNDLKALEESGQIKPREKQILQDLERDIRAIRKARDALGDNAPKVGVRGRQDNERTLGKRDRDGTRRQHNKQEPESDTDEDARGVPMPKDTPPPIPRQNRGPRPIDNHANRSPWGKSGPPELPQKPGIVPEAKTTYESAAQVRDLKREAVSRFIPSNVRRKQEAVKGAGRLVEPEEFDRLEKAGYLATSHPLPATTEATNLGVVSQSEDSEAARRLAEEEAQFRREMKQVTIEEVEDEDL